MSHRKARAAKRPEKPRDPYVEIEQEDVNKFTWKIRDSSKMWYSLYGHEGTSSSLARAERAGGNALRAYLGKKAVEGRKWTLTLEDIS